LIPAPSDPFRGHGTLLLSIGLTLIVQILVSLVALTVPIVAPAIAADFGLDSATIGFYPMIMYSAAITANLQGGWLLDRFGAMGLSVLCVVLCAIGLLFFLSPTPWLFAIGAFLIGFGYGPVTPASSQILSARVPPRLSSVIFSIKQTGVPIGGVLAGGVLPVLILGFGWPGSVLAVALLSLVTACLMAPAIRPFDAASERPLSGRVSPFRLLGKFARSRALRNLSLASSTFGAMQLTLSSFLTFFLVEQVRLDLVTAGVLFGASQIAGTVGRILWGFVADRLLAPRYTLVLIGALMTAAAGGMSGFAGGSPFWLILLVCILYGATATGWNGVFLSEVARLAAPGQAGVATGVAMVFTFAGVMIGPFLFSLVLRATDQYRLAFLFAAGLSLIGTWLALFGTDRERTPANTQA
jgi:MFS family permease